MSIFGLYFTKNMLMQTGWPRKQGLLDKQIVNSMVYDNTIDQMIDWAAALGAGNPKLSLQIISYMFQDKDWDGPDRPQIKTFIEGVKKELKEKNLNLEKTAPHDIVEHTKVENHFGENIDIKVIQDKRNIPILEYQFLSGLLYGLGNASSYNSWYQNHLEEVSKKLPEMKKAGLYIDELPSLNENSANSEQIIKGYEEEMGISLPSIPDKLLDDAKGLGIKIN